MMDALMLELAFYQSWFSWPLIILTIWTIIMVAMVTSETIALPSAFLIVSFVGLWWFGFLPVHSIVEAPFVFAGFAFAYFIIGAAWMLIKWYLHVHKARREFDERVADIQPDSYIWGVQGKHLTPAHIAKHRAEEKPMVGANKQRVMSWMLFWPWSILWFIINDPVRRIAQWVYSHLRNFMQAMSDRAFGE